MEKYTVLAVFSIFSSLGFAGETQNAQLAVQNEVMSPLSLHCVTRSDVVVTSGLAADGNLQVDAGGSAALQFTFNHYSKKKALITCAAAQDNAGFAYLALSKNKEAMQITPSNDAYNFYYDGDYTGSVVYR